MKDVFMKEDCDLLIRKEKISIARDTNNEALKNLIIRRIQSVSNDWKFEDASVARVSGLELRDYMGSPVTIDLIAGIKYAMISALTEDTGLEANDIIINDLPIDRNNLILQVNILTDEEKTDSNINLQVLYDVRQSRAIPKIINVENDLWRT